MANFTTCAYSILHFLAFSNIVVNYFVWKKSPCFKYFIFIIVLFVLFFRGYYLLDPDFGWHFKMGELIASNGIPSRDAFSYTMPSFSYVDHEWLTDLLSWHLINAVGYSGLVLFYVGAVLCVLWIVFRIKFYPSFIVKDKRFDLFLFLLTVGSLLPFYGVRPQVLSWLFYSVVLFLVFGLERIRWYVVVPLFVLWANLHGSFPIGLLTLCVALSTRFVQKKISLGNLLFILLGCLLVTLVNPYGIDLWREVFGSTGDAQLRVRVVEWYPTIFQFNIIFYVIVSLWCFLSFIYRNSLRRDYLIVGLFVLPISLSSLRLIPFFVLYSIPGIRMGFLQLYKQAKKRQLGVRRLAKVTKILLLFSLIVYVIQGYFAVVGARSVREQSYYPASAILYLQAHPFEGNLFSYYGWGGYLIWKYPEKAVFIDGRMPSWKNETAPESESRAAMDEYIEAATKENYGDIFTKYNITTVLWPKRYRDKKEGEFVERLNRDNWKVVYEDEVAIVLSKR